MNDNHLNEYDLEYELERIKKFKEYSIPEFYQITRSITRSTEISQSNRGFGHHLIIACPTDTIRRYETLVFLRRAKNKTTVECQKG